MAAAKKNTKETEEIQSICKNRRAYHEYEIFESLECGLVLMGTEVKSLRAGQASLEDAYAKIEAGEVWLVHADIPEYEMGNRLNHKPKRIRKLLLHKREIEKFIGKASERGFTLVPLRLYFKQGRAKVEIAIARGKKLHDKREAQKKTAAKKEINQAMKHRR